MSCLFFFILTNIGPSYWMVQLSSAHGFRKQTKIPRLYSGHVCTSDILIWCFSIPWSDYLTSFRDKSQSGLVLLVWRLAQWSCFASFLWLGTSVSILFIPDQDEKKGALIHYVWVLKNFSKLEQPWGSPRLCFKQQTKICALYSSLSVIINVFCINWM